MTTDDDPIFVDTNILVYCMQLHSPFHQTAKVAIERQFQKANELCISRQIIREFLSTMTRAELTVPKPNFDDVADRVESFPIFFRIFGEGTQVTSRLLSLVRSHHCAGKQIHDANIVATMLAHGISKLLTHNVADFNRYSGLIEVVPLIP